MISSESKVQNKNDDEVMAQLFESFTLMPQIMDKYETHFLRVRQSELYKPAGMIIPKLPMYHPYHPFKNVSKNDEILQVPLAVVLPAPSSAPISLLNIAKKNTETEITSYLIVQTLPYDPETEVICRYQYALFPEAKSEMNGHESIWAQSLIYEKDHQYAKIPATQIKIYESEKNKLSPSILCGNSMKLGNVNDLRGRCLWSLVLGSHTGTLKDDGFFAEISHAFIGLTYFIHHGDAYQNFLHSMKKKSTREILNHILDLKDADIKDDSTIDR